MAGVLFFALLISGCASTPQTRALLDDPPPSVARQAELTDTPFYPQEKYQCGPAALATILVPLGRDVSPDELVGEVYLPAREGSLQAEMRAAIRKRGLLAVQLAPSLDTLLVEVAHGRPVLVLQNLGLRWYPRWHYAVVVGYDLEKEHLVLRSGTEKRWITPLTVFERTWARGRHWAIVAVPPGEIPSTASPLEMLKATSALEQTGNPASALTSYQAIVRRWPGNELAHFSLANAYMMASEAPAAENHYRFALELNPTFAEAWNNLAYALANQGCHRTAHEAAACAVRHAPEESNFRNTLREHAGGRRDTNDDCARVICPAAAAPEPLNAEREGT